MQIFWDCNAYCNPTADASGKFIQTEPKMLANINTVCDGLINHLLSIWCLERGLQERCLMGKKPPVWSDRI